MGTPQILVLVVFALELITASLRHGLHKSGKYNIIDTIRDVVFYATMMYWGGFFNN